MLSIPNVSELDVAFGNVSWLPKMKDIPEEFKEHNLRNKYCAFISKWFFIGLTKEDFETLIPKISREDIPKALAAISACMKSFEPKHEHKEAGCAYMLSEWFEIK